MADSSWADGWAKIISALGVAIKDVVLALGVLWGAYSVAGQGSKLDVAAETAKEVKHELRSSTEARDKKLSSIEAKIDAGPMGVTSSAPPPPQH